MGLDDITSDFVDRVGADGFTDIKDHTSCACKIFWILLVVVAWILGFYQSALMVKRYLEYGKDTTYELHYNPKLQFPAVSFCNNNPLRMSQGTMTMSGMDKAGSSFMENMMKVDVISGADPSTKLSSLLNLELSNSKSNFWDDADDDDDVKIVSDPNTDTQQQSVTPHQPDSVQKTSTTPSTSQYEYEASYMIEVSDDTNTSARTDNERMKENVYAHLYNAEYDAKVAAGHQLTDMLLECTWKKAQCKPKNDFSTFFHPAFGNCYSFNAGWLIHDGKQYKHRIRNTSVTGPDAGLSLMLFAESEEYIPGLAVSAGFRVMIHSQYDVPFMEDSGVAATVGSQTTLAIKKNIINRLHNPYNKFGCGEDQPFPMQDIDNLWPNGNYSQIACMKMLYQHDLINKCNCIDPLVFVGPGYVPCNRSVNSDYTCISGVAANLTSGSGGVSSICPPSCTEENFEIQTSIEKIPADTYINKNNAIFVWIGLTIVVATHYSKLLETYVVRNMNLLRAVVEDDLTVDEASDLLMDNIVVLKVFYKSLTFTAVTESPDYEFATMLGDIGGVIGLWAGVSVISFIQIMEFLVRLTGAGVFRRPTETVRYK